MGYKRDSRVCVCVCVCVCVREAVCVCVLVRCLCVCDMCDARPAEHTGAPAFVYTPFASLIAVRN